MKGFEAHTTLLPNTFILVRLDGKAFTQCAPPSPSFTQDHAFEKPNDLRAVLLMNECAAEVMRAYGDIFIAYGESDEFSFIFSRKCSLYSRRQEKIMSSRPALSCLLSLPSSQPAHSFPADVLSLFSSSYVFFWPKYFPDTPLKRPPSFDARTVAYPSLKNVKDYLAWRQVGPASNELGRLPHQ